MSKQTDWPERIVYVCSASRGAKINRMPLRYASAVPGRVVGVVILVGVAENENPDRDTMIEAIEPARRIEAYALNSIGLAEDRVRFVYKPSGDALAWLKAMKSANKIAQETGAEIVFNYTGGTKDMAIGAVLGLTLYNPLPRRPLLLSVSHHGHPRLITLGENDPTVIELPEQVSDTLEDFLASYGLREVDPVKRKTETKWSLQNEQARALRSLLAINDVETRSEVIGAIYDNLPDIGRDRIITESNPLRSQLPQNLNPTVARAAGDFLSEVSDVTFSGPGFVVTSRTAYEFLMGKWLEVLVYARVHHALKNIKAGRSDAPQIILGLHRGAIDEKGRSITSALREMDVSVFFNDTIIPISCKAKRSDNKGQSQEITVTSADGRDLSGPGTPRFLVAPILKKDDGDKLKTIADRAGVTALTSWSELDTLGDRIEAFIQRS
jgi:hypothetical protein